ncbi:MAG: TonB-dependent receptor, partial [Methylomonas sp.]
MKKNLAFALMLPTSISFATETTTITELEEVTVTAPSKPIEIASPSHVLSDNELAMKVGSSIGDTLKNELGISNQSFGPGVGTPVIRGQSGSRVKVLNNGIGSNDVSAISPDHASSVEPLLAEKIEVLRGPAALLYSGGAMGGIVNVVDNRIPSRIADKVLGGGLEQRFDSTSDETSTTLKIEGGKDQLAYHLDGFYRHRNNMAIGGSGIDSAKVGMTDPSLTVIDNPKGYLNNTGAEAISGSAGLSWVGTQGFAGLSINNLDNYYGIAPNGNGEEQVGIALRQQKYDFKSELNNPFKFAKTIRSRLGYTDYQHTEIANGEAGAFYTNKSYEGRVELSHQDLGLLHGIIGFQAQASDFNAIEKLTGESIVPRSDINTYSAFVLESFELGSVTYQFGTRVEQTKIQPDSFANLNYTPVSASASALWKLDQRNSLNLALTRSSRAPQVQELLANGYHDATRSYEHGDLNLGLETAYNLDLGYRFKTDWLRAELDVFHNWAGDYIYQQRNGHFVNQPDVGIVPVLQSAQADAIFKGYEAKLILPMMENHYGLLDLTLFSDYTRGQFVNGANVPRMPPLRYGVQLDYNQNQFSSYLRLTRADNQVYIGEFDTTTAGYFLLNVGVN